jgi:hypothetical protein
MRSTFLFIALMAAMFLASAPARAVPAPMSAEELVENSDVVARVRVVSVTCEGIATDDATGEQLPFYSAELEVLEATKGNVQPGDILRVRFRTLPSGIVGPWSVWYYPGEEVWTHLQRDDGGSGYGTTWWNARGETLREADITELPVIPGVTVRAP